MTFFWVIASLSLVTALEYLLYKKFALRGVLYERSFSKTAVFEGESLQMKEAVTNKKPLPLPWLKVEGHMAGSLRFDEGGEELSITDDIYHQSMFTLGAFRKITRVHEVKTLKRGCYDMQSVSIMAGDALGLTYTSTPLNSPLTLVVYPRVLGFETLRVDSHRYQGDVLMRRFIEPDPFLINGIRPYQNGDSMRDIHWGATARTGELQVKSRDYTASPRLLVIFNIQNLEEQWGESIARGEDEDMERGFRLCATYAAWACKTGAQFAFFCNGRYGMLDDTPVESAFGFGEEHFRSALEVMARTRLQRRLTIASYLDTVLERGIREADIVIVSAYWSDMLEKQAKKLRSQGNSVLWHELRGEKEDA